MAYVLSNNILWLLPVIMTYYTVTSLNECDSETSVPLRLELETDYCASETSWYIRDAVNDDIILNHGPYENDYTIHNETYCVPSNKCLIFTMKDLYGEFDGYYKLFYDGEFFKKGTDFGFQDSTIFGSTCPTKEPTRSPTKESTRSPTKEPTRSPSKSPTTRSHSALKDQSAGENGMNKRLIISASLGGVAGLTIIIGILYVALWRKRKTSDPGQTKPPREISFT